MAERKEIKNKEEILQLLEVVWKPSKVPVIHCRGHQRGPDPVSKGNRLADQAAKEAAHQLNATMGPRPISKVHLAPKLPVSPKYTKEEEQLDSSEGETRKEG